MAGKTSQYAAKIVELERNVKETESKATNIEKMVFESEREAGQ
jgi:septal ring factor EnvC (AmiA/AmiB activator)